MSDDDLTEQLCEEMHDRYEAAAAGAGWETNPQSRVPWADVPEANKAAMRAAVGPIAARIAELEAELHMCTADCAAARQDRHRDG